jgi:hypothetical protein
MSGYTRTIVVHETPTARVSMIENGGALFPGMTCTCTGETWPDIAKPDAISDSVFGIVGVPPGKDVDTVIADNTEVPVFRTGSGAIVYAYHKGTPSGGSVVAGDIMVACGLEDTGFIAPLAKQLDAITAADYTSTVLATTITILYSIVGRACETHASAANNVPIQIMLSV